MDGAPVKTARQHVHAACEEWGVDGADLELVLAELLNNAFQHAELADDDPVWVLVHIRAGGGEIVIEIVVPQAEFELPNHDQDVAAEGGRGLQIVSNLTRVFHCERRSPYHQAFIAVLAA
ncbi:ATP-binding protein [Streptomyces sp. SID3343]|uniref:ATP-binding protein n=1 Tax=Streptomyces sp. SID3343 TaxID=2690260 RepID=UPI0013714F4E